MGMKPQTTTVNPNSQQLRPLQGQQTDFLSGVYGGSKPFEAQTSPLQQQAVGNLGSFMNQPAPESRVLSELSPFLTQMMQSGLQQQGGMNGAAQNYFQQSMAPGANPGIGVVQAALPQHQAMMQAAQARLSEAAPGRFSSAFVSQGNDLAQGAMRDFNVFQQQALMQGAGLQQQQQNQAINFMLGAGQQGAMGQNAALGAAQLYGNLAGQAGMNPYQRLLGAGQLGNQITQGSVNPILQLMMGGLDYGKIAQNETIVGPSPFQQITGFLGGLGQTAAMAYGMKGR